MKIEEIKEIDGNALSFKIIDELGRQDLLELAPIFYIDLNIIDTVEKLVIDQTGETPYFFALTKTVSNVRRFPCRVSEVIPYVRATARQRAEACLLALQES